MLQRPANVLGRRAELIDRGPERPSTQRFKAGDAAAVAVQDQPAPGPACVVAVGGSLPPVHGDQAMLAVKEIQETSNRCPPVQPCPAIALSLRQMVLENLRGRKRELQQAVGEGVAPHERPPVTASLQAKFDDRDSASLLV
ncbi:expressed protein [Chlorella variabilis]|uniref:Expressed protein n=1 Tax=Chlorella variabilis TaxID=554065 RepID=E1ZBM5_CHLVA|nr:expressed protein [Chlorella variabilis]EFN56882.1 expressed protein [Chlorella variabilis]|eukprot:XP_005848984.1 expressed protein [Chlorella variabilis]